ncbi:hypothetical protein Tco_1458598 [Tanacetum coccineum]
MVEDKQPEREDKTRLLVKEEQERNMRLWKIKTGLASIKHRGLALTPPLRSRCISPNSWDNRKREYGFKMKVGGGEMRVTQVISKWKAGLKDDMDARSDVYVISNGCKKCSDDSDGYYWESIHNEKLVQTLLKGHSILLLEGSLSEDVENNGKWSCIYAVGSQEYQMVCTRLDIASADVDQLQVAYMILTEAAKEAIWLKRLAIESGFKLKIVAGIAIGALSKAIPSLRFQHRLNLLSIGIG